RFPSVTGRDQWLAARRDGGGRQPGMARPRRTARWLAGCEGVQNEWRVGMFSPCVFFILRRTPDPVQPVVAQSAHRVEFFDNTALSEQPRFAAEPRRAGSGARRTQAPTSVSSRAGLPTPGLDAARGLIAGRPWRGRQPPQSVHIMEKSARRDL